MGWGTEIGRRGEPVTNQAGARYRHRSCRSRGGCPIWPSGARSRSSWRRLQSHGLHFAPPPRPPRSPPRRQALTQCRSGRELRKTVFSRRKTRWGADSLAQSTPLCLCRALTTTPSTILHLVGASSRARVVILGSTTWTWGSEAGEEEDENSLLPCFDGPRLQLPIALAPFRRLL